MSITLAANEVIVTDGLENAKPFWTGVSTVPNTINDRGEYLYTGTFNVIDNTSYSAYDGFCQFDMSQRIELVGTSNPQYLALRETQYALPLFKTTDANVYSPVTVVFDWTGDPDSSAQFLVYSKKYPTTKYISIIFKGTEAAIVVNGDTQSVPSISSFFTDDRNIRKVSLDIYTQNTTKNIDTSASITGRLQIVLTDFQSGINTILYDSSVTTSATDTYQFEARLAHD